MKYLKKFENAQEYEAYINSSEAVYPNVCYIKESGEIAYNGAVPAEPTVIYLKQAITNPSEMITGEINGKQIQLIRSNAHRYLGKHTGVGEMTICQLKDSDSNYYNTEVPANLNGSEGDVFMRLPMFAYKVEDKGNDLWKISFIYGIAPDASWSQWDGNDLIGVYKSYVVGNKLYSRKISPYTNESQANYEAYAANRGEGFSIVKWKHHCIMAMLFYAIYGTTNSQTGLGRGGTSYTQSANDSMTDVGKDCINFCGLVGWWGGHGEWMTGVNARYNEWSIVDDNGLVRTVNAVGSDGYILKMAIGKSFDLVPIAVGGTDATGYCDEYRYSKVSDGVLLRSYYSNLLNGGISYINGNSSPSAKGDNHASRLVFRGKLIEETDAEVFKNIAAIS